MGEATQQHRVALSRSRHNGVPIRIPYNGPYRRSTLAPSPHTTS
jgi:hypothetical protein